MVSINPTNRGGSNPFIPGAVRPPRSGPIGSSNRGFVSLDPERQREVAHDATGRPAQPRRGNPDDTQATRRRTGSK